mgnify:CR=1 FL=1
MMGLECKYNFDSAAPYKGPKVEVVPEWQREHAALYKARMTKTKMREGFTPESELPFLSLLQIKHINKKLGHGKWLDDPFQNALKQARFDMGKGDMGKSVIHKSTTLDVIDTWLEAAQKIRSEKGAVASDEAEVDGDEEDAFGGGRRKSKKRKKRTKRRNKKKSKKRKSKKRTRRRRR